MVAAAAVVVRVVFVAVVVVVTCHGHFTPRCKMENTILSSFVCES